MKVQPEKAAASAEHAGRTWYFCGQGCAKKFHVDPKKYDGSEPAASLVSIGQSSVPKHAAQYTCPMHPEVHAAKPGACPKCGMALEPLEPAAAERIEFTCPMHPEIVRDRAGSCPICGMALEPRSVTADVANPEMISMTRRLWVCALLTLPLLAIMFSEILPGDPLARFLPAGGLGWLELILATPVVLWGGWPFFERGWASIVHRSLNMFTLIAMGIAASYLYSVVAVVAPGLFPASFRDGSGRLGLYFEAA